MSDALTRVLIPCVHGVSKKAVIFDRDDSQNKEQNDFLMHDIASAACADPMYFPASDVYNSAKTAKTCFMAGAHYKNDAVGVLRDEILDKVPQRILMLTLSAGVNNEANSRTPAILKEKLGSDYCHLQPRVDADSLGKPDDTDPRMLDRYIAFAQKALDGNEAFIRRLRENRKKS